LTLDDKALSGRSIGIDDDFFFLQGIRIQNIKTAVSLPIFFSLASKLFGQTLHTEITNLAVAPSEVRQATAGCPWPTTRPQANHRECAGVHQRLTRTSLESIPKNLDRYCTLIHSECALRKASRRLCLGDPHATGLSRERRCHTFSSFEPWRAAVRTPVSPTDLHDHMEINGSNEGAS
jgi:hypothetical protein